MDPSQRFLQAVFAPRPAPPSAGNAAAATAAPPGATSPAHAWFCGLAAAHAAGAAAAGLGARPPLRFVSLQSDPPRAKALCRQLGVSASLSAAIVDPCSGRKLTELCGRRMQDELPAGACMRACASARPRPVPQAQPGGLVSAWGEWAGALGPREDSVSRSE